MDENVQKIDLMQYFDRFWRTLLRFKLILFLLFVVIVAFCVIQESLFPDDVFFHGRLRRDQSGRRQFVYDRRG